jgi:uncharacterized protein (TIGR03089 family)
MSISGKADKSTVVAIFDAAVRADPTRPLLTFYDDATGERTELSGATLANWVAKTANLLVDGCGLGPGDQAAVLLPPHWQSAAVLLGAWTAGLTVTSGHDAEVVFAALDRLDEAPDAPDRFALGLAPMALALREVPKGFVDYVAEVRGHGDQFRPALPIRSGDLAVDDTTHEETVRAAGEIALAAGIGPHDRVLVDADSRSYPLVWLLAPLAVGASIVLCVNLDAAEVEARRDAERITRLL